jgi:hypothetical protein
VTIRWFLATNARVFFFIWSIIRSRPSNGRAAVRSTLYVKASAWTWATYAENSAGFTFAYWLITRTNGTQYRDCNPDLIRPADTDEYDYHAIFIECVLSSSGSNPAVCINQPGLGTQQMCQ